MVENNRAIAFTFAAYPGREPGTGNIAHKRSHNLSGHLLGRLFSGPATQR